MMGRIIATLLRATIAVCLLWIIAYLGLAIYQLIQQIP